MDGLFRQRTGGETGLTTHRVLNYRPPYRWETILNFLGARAIPGVEMVADGEYRRTVRLQDEKGKDVIGWLRVGHRPAKKAVTVTVSETLWPVLPRVAARIRRLFDLDCDPDAVYEVLASMNELYPGLCVPGTRLPGSFDAFEMSVRAVLGQQITVQAASTLAGRLAAAYGTPVETGLDGLTHIFPSPADILALEGTIESHLGPLGVMATRAGAIRDLARARARGDITFGPQARPEKELKKLLAIRGIGNWTAQYIAMRAMGWRDAFLETDAGVKRALHPHKPKEILKIAEAWRPYRSYATINLWNSLAAV